MEPLVSILMTAFNRERYIADAIKSVLASSYKNFELIVVDDCSTDQTVAIAHGFAATDSRIKVFVNEKNLGDYPNRNMAASFATGKYLKYIDADDLIYPWGLEILVNCMEQFPEAGWGLCSLEQNEKSIFPFMLNPNGIYNYAYLGPGLFHKSPLSAIIKKTAFEQVNGFSGKKHLGDFEIWHVLGIHCNLVLMPHGLVWYRKHDEQQSLDNRVDPEVSLKYTISALNFFKSCPDIPLDAAKKGQIISKLRWDINRLIGIKIMKLNLTTAYKLFKASKNSSYNLRWKVSEK